MDPLSLNGSWAFRFEEGALLADAAGRDEAFVDEHLEDGAHLRGRELLPVLDEGIPGAVRDVLREGVDDLRARAGAQDRGAGAVELQPARPAEAPVVFGGKVEKRRVVETGLDDLVLLVRQPLGRGVDATGRGGGERRRE